MDFGGILAGAMAGGGKALQQNAQSQLEKQREQALIQLEQNRADQRAAATAQAEALQAERDRQAEEDLVILKAEQDRKTANNERNSEAYSNAYAEAQEMTDSAFDGWTEIASGPTAGLIENMDQIPEYNSIFARNLRIKASAIDDPNVRDRLIRQADALESMDSQGGGGNNDPLGIR